MQVRLQKEEGGFPQKLKRHEDQEGRWAGGARKGRVPNNYGTAQVRSPQLKGGLEAGYVGNGGKGRAPADRSQHLQGLAENCVRCFVI